MNKYKLVLLLVALFGSDYFFLNGQPKASISGYVTNASTGEELIGATVFVSELNTGIFTNNYGFYSLSMPQGKYSVSFSFMGFDTQTKVIDLNTNTKLDIELLEKSTEIKEIKVTAEGVDRNIKSTEMSVVRLNVKEIKQIPVIFGEQDILKIIQLMPGVKAAGEGNSGFYVRGGGADQNLVLLDEAPVYNASHLLGFFSVFNSDAINDAKLFKGGIPAEYGGRLSSVLDVNTNNGNLKQFSASGGIGLISSRLTLEAPIIPDRASFVVSGRRTYADLFLKLSKNENQRNTSLYFYDINAKVNYKVNDKNRIFLSSYSGRDLFKFADQFGINWGNVTSTFRWNHVFGEKLFLNTSLIYSIFDYGIEFQAAEDLVTIESGIEDFNWKEDFQYSINPKQNMKFGLNVIHHTFKPGTLSSDNQSVINGLILEQKYAIESAAYFAIESNFSSWLKVNYGVRYSRFDALGPGSTYAFDSDDNVMDTLTYAKNEQIAVYDGLEPRVSVNFILNDQNSIKLSYNRTHQFIHLLSTSSSGSPTDLWIPSSDIVKPQEADQVAMGYFFNFKENVYESSVEVYYKDLRNQIDYQNGADILLNELVESQLVFGVGRSYGVELLIQKNTGKLTGWIGYTLSRTERLFDEINQNEWYPAKQDRTHDVSIVAMYRFNPKWTVSGSWVYNTGDAVTFPSGKYNIDGQVINLYTERNGYRMPSYHRLDLGATFTNKKRERWESSWNFSIYNVYARYNAYSISFRANEDDPSKTEAVQMSLFSIIPSITYNFKF